MSSTYTGVPGNVTPSAAVDITEAADGDSVNAAARNVGLSELTDYVAFFKQFVPGLSGDTGARFTYDGAITDRKLVDELVGGTVSCRAYVTAYGLMELVVNASWDGAVWNFDAAGSAMKLQYMENGLLTWFYSAADGWADGAWVLASGNSATDFTHVGNLISSGGSIEASTGNITASSGNVDAQGAPVGDAGPGLVKYARTYSRGTAMVVGDVTISAGYGAGATVDAVAGIDQLCTVKITANGAGLANPAVFVVTWKDGTWTTTPVVVAWLIASDDAAAQGLELTVTPAATTLTVSMPLLPTAAKFYKFAFSSVGR